MSTSSASPSWRAESVGSAFAVGGVAVVLFAAAWVTTTHGRYAHREITDVPVYERYGDAVLGRAVPYRDFALEYPPAALPVFVLPALGHRGDTHAYKRWFGIEMWVCGALALLCTAFALRALRAPPLHVVVALGLVVLAPLLLGSTIRLRFDLWPAALTAGFMAALLSDRRIAALALLGVAVAAKVYAAVLLPIALVYLWRRRGARAARSGLAAFAVALATCVIPFLVLAPDGLVDSFTRQASRPLQIESLGAAFLLASHHLFGTHLELVSSYGSQNLSGRAAGILAGVTTALQVVVLVALWVAFARGGMTKARLVRYSAAAVSAFVAFGKVLSPQFMIWLVPLVPLVRGRRGAAATALLGSLLVVTQLWFPHRYWSLIFRFAARESWLVFVRDVGLAALVALLAYETGTRSASHDVARPS